jgi:hypothetical protein
MEVVVKMAGLLPGAFKCVCFGRIRKVEERREPESEVCIRCVR